MPIYDELVVVSADTPNFAHPGTDGLVVVDGQSVLSNDSDNPLKISAYDHKITCKGCSGGGSGSLDGAVRYDIVQTLTDEEKQRARDNIGIEDTPTPTPAGGSMWEETTETFIPFYLNLYRGIDAPSVEDFNTFVDRFYELEGASYGEAHTLFGDYKAALKSQYAKYLAALQAETPAQFAKRAFVAVTEDGASVDGYYSMGYDFSGDHCHVVATGETVTHVGSVLDKLAVDLPYMSKSYAMSVTKEGEYNGEGDYAKHINIVDVSSFNTVYEASIAGGKEAKEAVLDGLNYGGFIYNRAYSSNSICSLYDNLILCAKPAKDNGSDIENVVTYTSTNPGVPNRYSVLRPHTMSIDLYAVTNPAVHSGSKAVFGNTYNVQRHISVALPTCSDLTDKGSGTSASMADMSDANSDLAQFGIVETFSITAGDSDFTEHTFSVIVPKSGKIAKAKPFEIN